MGEEKLKKQNKHGNLLSPDFEKEEFDERKESLSTGGSSSNNVGGLETDRVNGRDLKALINFLALLIGGGGDGYDDDDDDDDDDEGSSDEGSSDEGSSDDESGSSACSSDENEDETDSEENESSNSERDNASEGEAEQQAIQRRSSNAVIPLEEAIASQCIITDAELKEIGLFAIENACRKEKRSEFTELEKERGIKARKNLKKGISAIRMLNKLKK